MKTKIALLIAIVATAIAIMAQAPMQFGHFIKTNAAADPPEALTTTNLMVSSVTLRGIKAARTVNVGTVYIGFTTNNDAQAFQITSNGEIVLTARSGTVLNLKTIYLDVVTAGDGVAVFYQ